MSHITLCGSARCSFERHYFASVSTCSGSRNKRPLGEYLCKSCYHVAIISYWSRHFSCHQASASSVASTVGTAGDLLHRTTAKTMEVLTTTGLTTKAVLTAVSDHRWWKESLNYLRPLQVRTLTVCVCVLTDLRWSRWWFSPSGPNK